LTSTVLATILIIYLFQFWRDHILCYHLILRISICIERFIELFCSITCPSQAILVLAKQAGRAISSTSSKDHRLCKNLGKDDFLKPAIFLLKAMAAAFRTS